MNIRTRSSAAVVLLTVAAGACMGWQPPALEYRSNEFTHQPPADGASRKPDSRPWSEVVGKQVRVEGIAWGGVEKGWGQYVLIDGARVYVDDAKFFEQGAEGKLVSVTGILTTEYIPAAREGAQGSSLPVHLFRIVRPAWKPIDRVTWPWMQEVP